jgi:hypothetical protein
MYKLICVKQPTTRKQDELLAASLAMLLATPPPLLPFARLLPPLRLALTTGTAHLPTARAALEALERWQVRALR